jgi:probable HAF family extracellular repeat protein
MVAIGDLPLGDGYVEANDVSGDGSVIVGDSNRLGGREAFRWTSSGMVGLGTLPGGTGEFFSVASGVSADGNTIIGRSGTGNGFQVFIWTADGGMQNLNDVLISQGVDLQGYKLSEAFGISDDGTKIVGIASKGDGYGEAFLVDLAAGAAPAKCPDIKGKWGYQATEVLSGNQFSAVGRGTFRGNGTWTMKLLGALEGEPGELVLRGDYSIDSKCIIEATYAIDDSDEGEGPATGNMASIIINEDKMYMMLAGQPFFNANVIAKRLMSLK